MVRSWRLRIIQGKFWNTYVILAEFVGIRIISNFKHKLELYYCFCIALFQIRMECESIAF
jgi:hypothetical protein